MVRPLRIWHVDTQARPIRESIKMISIALIEDNRLVGEGISSLLNRLPDIRVVAGDGNTMSQRSDIEPHIVLLDVGLPGGDSLGRLAQVRMAFPRAKVIAMDLPAAQSDLVDWVHAGVSGFIMKDATFDELVGTIRAVVDGEKVLPSRMTGTLFSQITRNGNGRGDLGALDTASMTPRERQVIALIAEGLSNKGIAAQLHIATHTVKSHVRNIMEKLSLRTRLQIAAYSHRLGQTHPAAPPNDFTARQRDRETPSMRSLPILAHRGLHSRSREGAEARAH